MAFIALMVILLWTRLFLNPASINSMAQMPLFSWIIGDKATHEVFSYVYSLICIVILLILMPRLNVIHYLLEERSFMPASLYLLIIAGFPEAMHINPIMIASIFLILALIILTQGEEHRAEPMSLFNATLVLAVGSLFYLKILWFIPFLWVTATIIRPLKWRGIVNPLIVIAMLALFYFTIYWVFIDDLNGLTNILRENYFDHKDFQGFSLGEQITLYYLLLLTIISSLYMLFRIQAKKIIIRKLYQVMFFLFLYTLGFYALASGFRIEMISIIAFPLAYLLSTYFHRKKTGWFQEILIWIWLGLLVYIHLF